MNVSATAGIAASWAASNAATVQQEVAMAVLKSQAEAGQAAVTILEQAVQSAPPPPPGQGRLVDKQV